jgi:predicted RNA-binding Zn-ribbon protein involved in translation (DUF1610 family)
MPNVEIIDKERGPRDAPCSRCGGDAEWSFVDEAETVVEIICPDCGRFEIPRAEFDQAETEIVDQTEERR